MKAIGISVFLLFLFSIFYFLNSVAFADEFTSSGFKVLEPVLQPAGYSTSSGYILISTISQIAIGTSTATGFDLRGGFLYFPFASSPVVTATAGDGQVSLSWTVSSAFWAEVASYDVGQSTASGGPYTFSAPLGNVTSSTRTGLTNGTTYYFVVRALDSSNVAMATSSEVSSAPVASAVPIVVTTPPVGGGGILGLAGLLFGVPTTIALPLLPIHISKCGVSDFNCDHVTDLTDVSVFLFLIAYAPQRNPADVNSDGMIDLVDASIVLSNWSGAPFEPPPPGYWFAGTGERFGAASAFTAQGRISKPASSGLQKEPVSTVTAETAGRNMLTNFFAFISKVFLGIWRILRSIIK